MPKRSFLTSKTIDSGIDIAFFLIILLSFPLIYLKFNQFFVDLNSIPTNLYVILELKGICLFPHLFVYIFSNFWYF